MVDAEILTIGHSTHAWPAFLGLLRGAGVTAVADVRSSPVSRHFPQFAQPALAEALKAERTAYVFLGRELGGRPRSTRLFSDGRADYDRMAREPTFAGGLERVRAGAERHRIALMCAEADPLDCHRCLLVGRALADGGMRVGHILADGKVSSHGDVEERLLASRGRDSADLFATREGRLRLAYMEHGRRVAFAESQAESSGIAAE